MIPSLPAELNVEILNYLSDRNVLNASQVNQATNAIVKANSKFVLSKFASKIVINQNKNSSYLDDVNTYKIMLHNHFVHHRITKYKDMKTLEQDQKELNEIKNKSPELIEHEKQLEVLMKLVAGVALYCLVWIQTPLHIVSDENTRLGQSMIMLGMLGFTAWYSRTKPNFIKE